MARAYRRVPGWLICRQLLCGGARPGGGVLGGTSCPRSLSVVEAVKPDYSGPNVTGVVPALLGVRPVDWLPAVSMVDPTVRYSSGLLTPEVGNSTKIGYFTRLPVYVAMSPSQDMTSAPTSAWP